MHGRGKPAHDDPGRFPDRLSRGCGPSLRTATIRFDGRFTPTPAPSGLVCFYEVVALLIEIKFYLISAFVMAAVWGLPAAGATLIYGVMRYPNFAIVQYMTLGAYLTLALAAVLPFWLAAIAAAAATGAIATLVDKAFFGPVRRAGLLPPILLSLGLMLVLENLVRFIWGNGVRQFDLPLAEPMRFAGFVISTYEAIAVAIAFGALVGVHLLLTRSRYGKSIRATANNPSLALTVGIVPERVYAGVLFTAGVLAATGGILLALTTSVTPLMGWLNLVPIFAVAILGGLGNLLGAAFAALVLAAVSELSLLVLPTSYKEALAFLVLALILMVRPTGLLKGEY